MDRRELLRALGASAVLGAIPRNARAAWDLVAQRPASAATLTPAQVAIVNAIGDTILPRTDTPGASDVGVSDWVDVVVSEYYGDDEKTAFLAGLDAIDAAAKSKAGSGIAQLDPSGRETVVASIEAASDRRSEPARTYWRLKGLVIHGYFTSERVQKEVLRTNIMPGEFIGDAPHAVGGTPR